MSEKNVQLNEKVIKGQFKELVGGSVEETLNKLLEAVGEVLPDAKYQRCTVHFYRNVFSVTPRSKVKLVAKMLKAIHAQEEQESCPGKGQGRGGGPRSMKLKEAAQKVENGIEETLTYCDFPSEHWTRIHTNNVIERLNREIRRRTRVVGSFPDGNSALMLVCARLRHVAGTQWGNKKYMNMKYLEVTLEDASIAGCFHSCQGLQTNSRTTVDSTLHVHRIEGNPPKNNLAIEKGQEILPFFMHLTLKNLTPCDFTSAVLAGQRLRRWNGSERKRQHMEHKRKMRWRFTGRSSWRISGYDILVTDSHVDRDRMDELIDIMLEIVIPRGRRYELPWTTTPPSW